MTEPYKNGELVVMKLNLWEPGVIGKISCMTGKDAERTSVALRLALYHKFLELSLHPKNRRVRRKILEKLKVIAEISEQSILIRWPGGHLKRIKLLRPIDITLTPTKGHEHGHV